LLNGIIALRGSFDLGSLLAGIKGAVDGYHLLLALLEFELVVQNSYLGFENLSDFADVFVFIEELLVVTAALGAGPSGYKGRQFVIELYFSG
jgi:hypothetical protein